MILAKQPIATTKLQVPPLRPSIIEREHLLEKLAHSLSRKLTIVTAPAGFGKTTLLSHWFQRSARDSSKPEIDEGRRLDSKIGSDHAIKWSWLTIDEDDNDPQRFLTYLAASLEGSVPDSDLGIIIASIRQTPQSPPLESVLTTMVNELWGSKGFTILVLDDYHLIYESQVHALLRSFIDNLPDNIHLLIATRSAPPLGMARMRARGQLLELSPEELSFQPEEAGLFLQKELDSQLTEAQITDLTQKTEGWIAGLQLAASSIRLSEDTEAAVNRITGEDRFIGDFLAEEVFAYLDPELQIFLLKTSILSRFCASLCERVTGLDNAQSLIEKLEQENIFIFPLDNTREWYRYHSLFSEFLRRRLALEMPEAASELNSLAAQWWADQGMTAEAVIHSLSAENYNAALDLIYLNAQSMLAGGEIITLVGWLESIPKVYLHQRPEMLLIYAWSSLISGRATWQEIQHIATEAGQLLGVNDENVMAKIAESSADPNVLRNLCFFAQLKGFFARNAGDWKRAKKLFEATASYPAAEPLVRIISLGGLGSLYVREGCVEKAEQSFAEITAIADAIDSLYLQVFGTTLQAQMQAEQGKLNLAQRNYELALSNASRHSKNPLPFSGQASVGLAEIHYERNDIDAALAGIEVGITSANTIKDTDALLPGYYLMARIRNSRGDLEGAKEALMQAKLIGLEVGHPNCGELHEYWQARFELVRGNLRPAAMWAGRIDPNSQYHDTTNPDLGELEVILYCRIVAVQQQADSAIQFLDRLLSKVEQDGRIRRAIHVLITRAICNSASGQNSKARSDLGRAMLLAEPEGYIRTFVDEGPALAPILRSAGKHGHSPHYVEMLLDAFSRESAQEHLKDPLSERELEVLKLAAAGLTNQQIANQLVIAMSTVKTHINRIYSKLDARSRTEAVARARKYNLID